MGWSELLAISCHLKRVTLVLHAGRPQNAQVLDEFAASQPLGYESCLDTPERYLYTKTDSNFSRQNGRHGDGHDSNK